MATYAHEARGTGHARGCMAFDVRAGGRVAAVDLPRRYGALGRAGSFFKTNRSASGPPLLASGSVSEPACALHADANKVVLGSPEGFAHVVDPRVWTVLCSFDLNVSGGDAGASRRRACPCSARVVSASPHRWTRPGAAGDS